MDSSTETIFLHQLAPRKPVLGEPCNGCGVCCALETCPVARVRFLSKQGPCPALEWSETALRYQCGLLVSPVSYFPRVPSRIEQWLTTGVARSIAAGIGCDCSVVCSVQILSNGAQETP